MFYWLEALSSMLTLQLQAIKKVCGRTVTYPSKMSVYLANTELTQQQYAIVSNICILCKADRILIKINHKLFYKYTRLVNNIF